MRYLVFGLLTWALLTPIRGADPLRILLTNDDGINAPGIQAMHKTLKQIGEVTVSAPWTNQSASSHSVTIGPEAITVVHHTDDQGQNWYTVQAKPATCVRLALENLLAFPPDLVISGSNRGANLGLVTYYSGTVGAAREAAFQGIPSFAVSVAHGPVMDYDSAARFVKQLVLSCQQRGLPKGTFLNVNYPALPREKIKGARLTRLSLKPPIDFFRKLSDSPLQFEPGYQELTAGEPGSDIEALRQGYISVTPIGFDTNVDLTQQPFTSWPLDDLLE